MKPLLTLSLILLLGFGAGCAGIKVSVENRSSLTVSEISLGFTGGSANIPLLPPILTKTVVIHPTGESSVQMSYLTGGNTVNTNLEVYIEPSYKGNLLITIEPDGTVNSVENFYP